ncbi:MAG: ABC transporter ATP-binding protein [Bacteroidales bacterium]|nr:ABC transporter ATP-binding protein [Bacteroidales bacterium]MBR3730867.1 ABC transporter ATP-binding protein [Bacteroidales bacterium]MBR6929630.1 ABC transporter ATP-binding protein [Bacteroidales bacterium]
MNLFQLFKNLRPFVKPYKWLVFITLILTLIGSLMAQVNAIVLDWTVDEVNNLVTAGEKWGQRAAHIVILISSVLLGKEILSAGITFAQNYFGERMRIFVSRDLAQSVIEKVLTFRMAFFNTGDNATGKLQARIDQGVSSLSRTVQNFFIDLLPLFTSALLALILMFAANVYVGLVALGIVPIYFWITYRQAKRLKGWRREMRSHLETKSQGIKNIIDSINVIKSFNREQIEGQKQLDIQNQVTENQMKTRKVAFYYNGIKSFVKQVGTVLVIILTAYLVLIDYPGMTIGKIMYHVMLFSNVIAPITQLQRIFDDVNDALIYAEGFFGILDAEEEVEPSGSYKPEKIHGLFELKNVDFTYPNGNQALFDVNMTIEPNKITALVGLSGAGKSTIVNLLDKFYEPQTGTITLDGIDLREYDTQFLRENIGLVLQKNHIFDGTIEENILYGKPNATHEEVVEAAKKSYIYDQIMQLPKQFENKASDLSGGQQQRIAIARMFLKNPPIIFLDEPTASLDAIATEQIKNSLDAIKKDRTVIIISHSISQIIDSDMVYALKTGHVEESGDPDEIYKKGGIYKDIIDASARSLNIEKIARTIDDGKD